MQDRVLRPTGVASSLQPPGSEGRKSPIKNVNCDLVSTGHGENSVQSSSFIFPSTIVANLNPRYQEKGRPGLGRGGGRENLVRIPFQLRQKERTFYFSSFRPFSPPVPREEFANFGSHSLTRDEFTTIDASTHSLFSLKKNHFCHFAYFYIFLSLNTG